MRNDEANKGDQLGLFGDGQRKPRPKFKAKEQGTVGEMVYRPSFHASR